MPNDVSELAGKNDTADFDLPNSATTRFDGHVDEVRPGALTGWAVDRTRPSDHVHVVIVSNGEVLAVIKANQEREDVAATTGAKLQCGFCFAISVKILRDSETISVIAVAEEIGKRLFLACEARDHDIDTLPISIHNIEGLNDPDRTKSLPWAS